ncbi:hypothetical protein DFH06DRAFT_1471587 [Mycena polygramma]|nr:hypothetical protein DFH06DRAFT_1471587 [Mycena polygramma]
MLIELEADRTRIAEIDAQILDLEWSLSVLRAKKTLVEQRLDSYRYPVLTLPNEIASEIFIQFLPLYPTSPPLAGPRSPVSLTQICRQWREIALATPALWRAITFFDRNITLERRCHMANMWLDRSGCCPLSMSVDEVEFLPTIIPYRTRLEHLRLVTFSSADLSLLEGPMPLLRRLDLRLETIPAFRLHDAPLLRDVTLNFLAVRDITLPWAQLTSLTLHDVNPDESAQLLQQTTNLVHCELFIWFHGDWHAVTLPSLQSLVLHDAEGPCRDSGFFESFTVPALRRLHVPELALGRNPIDRLSSFMRQSGCELHELTVYCFPERGGIDQPSFREAFASIPNFTFIVHQS